VFAPQFWRLRAETLCYNAGMKLRNVGEFELIDRMSSVFAERSAVADAAALSQLVMGIGDDAAVWRNLAPAHTIATTDAMVQGVHFTRVTADWYDLGWRAMASNISDIAGMGGTPRYALAVLAATGDEDLEDILVLCRGMADVAASFGASVIGGDTVTSPVIVLTITVLGEAPLDGEQRRLPLLTRSSARAGDVIAVTGQLGSSAGGLELLMRSGGVVSEAWKPLARAHRRPVPRVGEGRLLVQAGVQCGMDLSDGLAGDLKRICAASGLAAEVEAEELPLHPALIAEFGEGATDLALSGGEDYELLCVAPEDAIQRARILLSERGTPLTVVGRMVERETGVPPVTVMDADGQKRPPRRGAWEHFTSDGSTATT
jgi:thiamine-monophosphate kinase